MKTIQLFTLLVASLLIFLVVVWLKVSSDDPITKDNSNPALVNNEKSTITKDAATPDKVKVSVYYETLCPDSIQFITQQLWPTYQKVKDIINIELIPFGKASFFPVNGEYQFECQHGPKECKGNKIHACAIDLYPTTESSLPFVYCSMGAGDPIEAANTCATNNKLDWTQISSCASGKRGSELLLAHGKKTKSLNPKMIFVPWIIINDVFTNENEENSIQNFLQVVCSSYKGTLPPACSS